jgi:hypothetical protein
VRSKKVDFFSFSPSPTITNVNPVRDRSLKVSSHQFSEALVAPEDGLAKLFERRSTFSYLSGLAEFLGWTKRKQFCIVAAVPHTKESKLFAATKRVQRWILWPLQCLLEM